MASEAMRDAVGDPLLTPKNSTLIIIDYQPLQVTSIKSMDRDTMIRNIVAVAKIGRAFNLPIVHSSVNVKSGRNRPPIAQLRKVLGDIPTFDRTSINAWEDVEFVQAVKAAGRKKLIMTALWTEACLTFPTLDALRAGYEVYPVADAVGGTSAEAHAAGLRRIEQAGGRLTSVVQLLCELQRDWTRTQSLSAVLGILTELSGAAGIAQELMTAEASS